MTKSQHSQDCLPHKKKERFKTSHCDFHHDSSLAPSSSTQHMEEIFGYQNFERLLSWDHVFL